MAQRDTANLSKVSQGSRRGGVVRTAGFATTASALVALVAITALAANAGGRPLPIESRVAHNQSVRQVAQAVAAAARELVAKQRVVAAVAARPRAVLAAHHAHLPLLGRVNENSPSPRPMAERLLDLPPPAC
jgi:hypothetical protein